MKKPKKRIIKESKPIRPVEMNIENVYQENPQPIGGGGGGGAPKPKH